MKFKSPFILAMLILLMCACQPAQVCPPQSTTYFSGSGKTGPGNGSQLPKPEVVVMGNSSLKADQVVHGYLCNNSLSGTVYIACDVQVNAWQGKPTFLDGCDFSVAPGSVIYVAAHNNTAYYNGCAACHASSSKAP